MLPVLLAVLREPELRALVCAFGALLITSFLFAGGRRLLRGPTA
ncbi:hypothetical protein [Chelatococcus reniformis]|uniref:Uncharacterized protein n=1 Tax=Chelatococcus reniformis TaxID=1494448 RepID=A0A916XPW7_9HYPH|nr:hypothetical protein [Chelatococcus reniformis]GGC90638.1 hypothetical protein GCM10010994_55540 [Chelatococcus reniformis]